MKFDATKIALFISILLNALGGSGIIAPVVGGPAPAPACAPCPACMTSQLDAGQ